MVTNPSRPSILVGPSGMLENDEGHAFLKPSTSRLPTDCGSNFAEAATPGIPFSVTICDHFVALSPFGTHSTTYDEGLLSSKAGLNVFGTTNETSWLKTGMMTL